MHVSYPPLPPDEVEDFERICWERSRDPNEFVVQVVERTPVGGGHIEREITVSCGKTEVTFDGSSGTNWVNDFATALSAQTFGPADG